PIPPGPLTGPLRRLTERSATASEDRGQTTDDGWSEPVGQALQHPGDRLVFLTPSLPGRVVDVTQVQAVPDPYPHLLARPDRHLQETAELRLRARLTRVTFGSIGTDG